MDAPDSPMRHQTLSGAPATSPNREGSGAVDRWSFVFLWHRMVRCRTGQALFTVRCASGDCSDFCAHCSSLFTESAAFAVDRCTKESLLRWCTGQSDGTPDSPVNYSGAALEKPETDEFDPVQSWCTGQCLVAHRTVQCARPGNPWFFCSFLFEP
jgi:hypothetical protein